MKTAAPDFRLFWDNAYAVHHLTPERVEIDNIDEACARAGHPHRAFIFGSTSKMTFAGAGVGLFAGSTENVAWFMKRLGMRTIGGDKINQLRHVRLLKNAAGIDALMDRHRAIMAPKFEKVLELFDAHLAPAGIGRWTRPKGGYFITLDVPDGTAKRVVQLAREAGVELTPAGATHPYGKDPAGPHDSHRAQLSGARRSRTGGRRRRRVRAARCSRGKPQLGAVNVSPLAAGPHPRGELTPMLGLRSSCLRPRMAAGAPLFLPTCHTRPTCPTCPRLTNASKGSVPVILRTASAGDH